MTEQSDKNVGAWDFPARLLSGLAVLAGGVLFCLMLLVSYAVYRRYVANDPILGSQEIVQVGMSLVVMLAMPFATAKHAHIRVDITDRFLGDWGRFVSDIFVRIVAALVLFLLIRKTWDKAWDAVEWGDATNMLEIPHWIAYGAITAGMGLSALILVLQIVGQFRRGVRGYE